jgi:hypothetical protein
MANLIQRVEARSGHDCFDRVVSNGYLSALTRPEHAVYNNSSGKSLGIRAIHQRSIEAEYRRLPPEAEKGVRKHGPANVRSF